MDFIRRRSHKLGITKSGSRTALYLVAAFLLVGLPRLDFDVSVPPQEASDGRPEEKHAWLYGERMNINEASPASLVRIRGVGPSLAQKIDAHKKRHGPFKTWRDVLAVKGIGPKTLLKLEPYLDARVVGDAD